MDIDAYTKFDKELDKIPYCSSKCKYYPVCPVCDRSAGTLAICSMRILPEQQRRRFVNLYVRGRDGLHAEARELLFNLAKGLDLVKTPTDMITYIDTILKVDRAFKTSEKEMMPKMEAAEEIPDIVEVVVTEKAKKQDPLEKIVRKVEKELDHNPDSLFGSDAVDRVVAGIGKLKVSDFKKRKLVAPLASGGEFEP